MSDNPQTPTEAQAGQTLAAAHGSAEHRAQLWDAINEYAEACGGTPGARIYGNTKRQQAVAEIESLVYPLNEPSSATGAERK